MSSGVTAHGSGDTWYLWLDAPEELLGDVGGIFGTWLMGASSLSGSESA